MTQTYLKNLRRDQNGLIDFQYYHRVGKLERNREMKRLYNILAKVISSGLRRTAHGLTKGLRELVSSAFAGKQDIQNI